MTWIFTITQNTQQNSKNKSKKNKHTIDRFKVVADKDMRKMSNIVENLIRRYVENRVQIFLKIITFKYGFDFKKILLRKLETFNF